jgi:hypothetical protein
MTNDKETFEEAQNFPDAWNNENKVAQIIRLNGKIKSIGNHQNLLHKIIGCLYLV